MDTRFTFSGRPDDYYLIEAFGEHPNSAAGVVQVIDAKAGAAMVESFNRQFGPGSVGLLVDFDHLSRSAAHETRAAGWVESLVSRMDGLYAKIRWSDAGLKAVTAGEYRFFSTEYDSSDTEEIPGKKNHFRPTVLHGLALTNRPNNRGQRSITNRQVGGALSPKEASEGLLIIANRLLASRGGGFDAAWRNAAIQNPTLAVLSRGESLAELSPANRLELFRAQAAAILLNRATELHRRSPSAGFDAAWHRVHRESPELVKVMEGKIDGRFCS
jgi:hypothetical protein